MSVTATIRHLARSPANGINPVARCQPCLKERGGGPQAGFSMIEILIAVVVLAVGLLGVATLQLTSKQGNHEALQRATAVMLAEDLLDRIRNNIEGGGGYTGDGVGLNLAPSPAPDPAAAAATLCLDTDTGNCTPGQLAAYDLLQWQLSLLGASEGDNQGGLVAPSACLQGPVPPANGDPPVGVYTVEIAWRGLTAVNDPAVACGQDSGLYDAVAGSDDDLHRRVIRITAYIGV